MRIVMMIVLLLITVPHTFPMVARGGGAVRGPNNPLNNRGGTQKVSKKVDLVLAKEEKKNGREEAREKERLDIQLEREEKKRSLEAQNDARKAISRARE